MGVKVESDQETVRQAFLKLVKRFHPDSGSSEADPQKFQEVSFESVSIQINNYDKNRSWIHP